MTERSPIELARRLAPPLGEVPGVIAVSLGGSVARATDDADSDIDLGLYYRRGDPPELGRLRQLANEIDDRESVALTEIGGWGPRINGGGWLVVGGRRVDWLYREIEAVEEAIEACRAGHSQPIHQPGHSWGWQPQIYAGEVAYGVSLADDGGELERLRSLALPYPIALREAKVAALWEARFTLDAASRAAQRGQVVLVAAAVNRIAATLVDAIFALNGRYLVHEKQAVEIATGAVEAPAGTWDTLADVLGAAGQSAPELTASVERAHRLVADVAAWAEQR